MVIFKKEGGKDICKIKSMFGSYDFYCWNKRLKENKSRIKTIRK